MGLIVESNADREADNFFEHNNKLRYVKGDPSYTALLRNIVIKKPYRLLCCVSFSLFQERTDEKLLLFGC